MRDTLETIYDHLYSLSSNSSVLWALHGRDNPFLRQSDKKLDNENSLKNTKGRSKGGIAGTRTVRSKARTI